MAYRKTFLASILFIVLFTLCLQRYFFVGITGQYGEEAMFVQWALAGLDPNWSYSDLFTPLRATTDWAGRTGDPSEMYPFRIAALYPNSLFVRWFGAQEVVVCLWTSLTGILSIPVVIAIGERLHNRVAGLIAGIIIALTPGRIIYTSRIDTDMPQFLFLSVATYCIVRAYQAVSPRHISQWALTAGIFTGVLYLAKLTLGLFTLAAILGLSLTCAVLLRFRLCKSFLHYQHALRVSAFAFLGFLGIFSIENISYYFLSGHWFLHWRMMHGNATNISSWRSEYFHTFGILRIWDSPSGISWFTEHSRVLLYNFSIPIYNLPVHGWIGWAAIVATATAVLFRSWRKNGGLTLMILSGFAAYYLYNEFFWYYPTIEQGILNLTPIHKVHRFIFPCYLGAALLVGVACARLTDCISTAYPHRAHWLYGGMTIAVTVIYAIGSVHAVQTIIPRLRSSYAHFRSIGSFLRNEVPPMSKVFFPGYNPDIFKVTTSPTPYQWIQISPQDSLATLCGGWAVIVNNFGIGTSTAGIDALYPKEAKQFIEDINFPPNHWNIVWSDIHDGAMNNQVISSISKLPDC